MFPAFVFLFVFGFVVRRCRRCRGCRGCRGCRRNISEMERHKRLLAEDLMVMRVVSLWLHGPIGHSATEDDTKAHRKALQKLVADTVLPIAIYSFVPPRCRKRGRLVAAYNVIAAAS